MSLSAPACHHVEPNRRVFGVGLVCLFVLALLIGWGVAAEREPQGAQLQADADWTLVLPTGWTTRPTMVSAIAVDSDGLTSVTAFYRFSTNGGSNWGNWLGVDASVALDASTVHMTATIASLVDSATDNLVQFRITDKISQIELSDTYVIQVDSMAPETTFSSLPSWPAGGWFSSTVTINLLAEDSPAGVATTRWRLQGGLWHTGSVFASSGGGTYEYYSVDNAGNEEDVQQITIQTDTSAPTLDVSTTPSEPASGWFRTPVTATISASDGQSGLDGSAWYQLDGGPTETGTEVVISGAGTHSLHCYARDLAGNLSQQQLTIKIDVNPPQTTHSFEPALPPGGWFNGPVTVRLAASDDLSTVEQTLYRTGGGLWHLGNSFVVSEHSTYTYKSIDRAGNEETEKQVVVPIDTQPPTSSYQLDPPPPANGWYSTTVDVTITATDDLSGWAGDTRYSINGGPEQVGSSFQLADSGSYSLSYYSRDEAGNVEATQSVPVLCRIDDVPPTVSAVPDKTGVYVKPPVDIHLQASDEHSGVDYVQYRRQGETTWTSYDHILIPGAAADGVYTYEYRAFDQAGHMSAGLISLNVDGTPPLAASSLVAHPAGWTNQDSFDLSWNNPGDFSGISGVYYQMDVDPTISRNGQLVYGDDIRDLTSLAVGIEGAHDVYIWLVDGAGNETHWMRAQLPQAFKLDTTPPTSNNPIITGPQQNGYYTGPVNVTLQGSDNLSGIETFHYVTNGVGGVVSLPAGNPTFIVSQDGRSIIESWATDEAGNTQTYSRTDTIRIDTTPPASPINLLSTPSEWTKTNSFSIAWVNPLDYSGVKAVYYKKGSAPTSASDGQRAELAGNTWVAGITAPGEGQTTLYVWLEDLAGNADHNTAVSALIKYDASAPETNVTPSGVLGQNGYYVSAVTFSLAASDNASGVDEIRYRTRLSGGDWGNWTVWSGAGVWLGQEGVHDVEFYGTDHAGNQELPPQQVSYKIDLNPPACSVATSGDYVEGTCVSLDWAGWDGLAGVDHYAVQYRQGKLRPWQDWRQNTSATSGNFCLLDANQFYYFRAKAWDKAGRESPWSEVAGDAYVYREGLDNPSFDLCDYGAWLRAGQLGGDIVYAASHGGGMSCQARLAEERNSDDYNPIDAYGGLSQPIALPALDDSEGLILSFWYRIQTYDLAWGLDTADGQYKFFDPFRMYVRNIGGAELGSWLPDGNLTDSDLWEPDRLYDSGWRQEIIDLTPWAGQLVQFDFRVWSLVDEQWPTWAYVDDVKLLPKPGRIQHVPLICDYDSSYVPPAPAGLGAQIESPAFKPYRPGQRKLRK